MVQFKKRHVIEKSLRRAEESGGWGGGMAEASSVARLGVTVETVGTGQLLVRSEVPAHIAILQRAVPRFMELVAATNERSRGKELDALVELFVKAYSPQLNVHDPQLERNARERARFAREYQLWDARHVDKLLGSKSRHPGALANKLKTRGKLFSVSLRPEYKDLYPAFQFDQQSGKPLEVIEEILTVFAKKLSGWEVAFWFVTENGWLEGDGKPVELLAANSQAVVEAARHETEELIG